MDVSSDPFPPSEPDPTALYSWSLPIADLMEHYGGEHVIVRTVGEKYEVVVHGDDLAATLAAPERREDDISLYVPAKNEERI